MDRNSIHRQMSGLLKELQELNSQMTNRREKIPALEMDAFRMKLITLYDQLNQLAIANRSQAAAVKSPLRESKAENEPEVEEAPAPVIEKPIEMPPPVEEQVNPVFIPEMPYEIEEDGAGEEQQEEAVPEEEEVAVNSAPKNEEPATLKSDNGLSLHEKLSKASQPSDLVQSLKLQPLADLRDGMSTSQRFQYIANLFGNDGELFNHSINYINSASSKKDADDYLRINIEKKYKWNDEDPLVNEFKTLISRRFM